MSNFDRLWTERQREEAAAEGWELAFVVNEGKPVFTAYLDIFDKGPRFKQRSDAVKHVLARAQERSNLHVSAMAACAASRVTAAEQTAKRRR